MDEAPSSSSFSSSSSTHAQGLVKVKEEISPSTRLSSLTSANNDNFIRKQDGESKIVTSDNGDSMGFSSNSDSNVLEGNDDGDKGMEVEQEDGTHAGDKDMTTVDGVDSVSKSSDRRDDDEVEDDDDDCNASGGMEVETDLREYDNSEYSHIRSMERMSSVDTLNPDDQEEDIETEKVEGSVVGEEDKLENRNSSTLDSPDAQLKVDVPKTEEEQLAEDMASMLPVAPETIPSLPSLRGKMIIEGNPEEGGKAVYIFNGIWALSEKAHNNGNTANFEYTQVQPDASSSVCYSGKYSGHFYLKQGKNLVKHDDIVDMKFELVEGSPERAYDIIGHGKNSFGKFLIQGEMKEDKTMIVYKVYLVATPKPRSKRSDTPKVHTPRESTPRVIKERQILEMPPVRSTSGGKKDKEREEKAKAKAHSEADRAEAKEKLAKELEEQLRICKELLTELMDLPCAQWFLTPVDPIRMHLPDYFSVVKEPMDLGTIKTKFSNGLYDNPEPFCADMRLTFRNAMLYNHQRDNPVHVAARDMLGKFEEKFRTRCGKFSSSLRLFSQQAGKPTSLLKKSSTGRGGPSGGIQRSSSASSAQQMKTPKGPRTPNNQQYTPSGPPGALESEAIAEMSKKMEEMQTEMMQLRAALVFPEMFPEVALTQEEQARLVDQIHNLSPDKLDFVIEIIQANAFDNKALSDGKYIKGGVGDSATSIVESTIEEDDDTVKIPLHALDIKTLRSLQRYVDTLYEEDQAEKKHRKSSTSKKRAAKDSDGEKKNSKSPKLEGANDFAGTDPLVLTSDGASFSEAPVLVGAASSHQNLPGDESSSKIHQNENLVDVMSECVEKEVTAVATHTEGPLLKAGEESSTVDESFDVENEKS